MPRPALESALVVALRRTIPWESSLQISSVGTLTPVNPSLPFNALEYQYRDRELAFRDLVNAAAVVEVSMEVSDVFLAPADLPVLPGPVTRFQLYNAGELLADGTYANTTGLVRHVSQASVPADAYRYADKDLYGRDLLLYETLARAASDLFTAAPPIPVITSGTVVQDTQVWPLSPAQSIRADINAALPLNRDLFALPDLNLADRDNIIAVYVARLAQALRNPFAFAERIYVRVSGEDPREPEEYVLRREYWQANTIYRAGDEVYYLTQWYRAIFNTASPPTDSYTWQPRGSLGPVVRTYVAEPALAYRNRIVYDGDNSTLQWFREDTELLHVPQIYAMSIPGILPDQRLDTLAQVPELQDAQFYRQKSAKVEMIGETAFDVLNLGYTSNDQVTGGYMQVPCASLTTPDVLGITMNGSVGPGDYRMNVLVTPSPEVEIAGARNVSGTSGTLGGATLETNVGSNDIQAGVTYLVRGNTVVYNGVTFYPNQLFTGLSGVTSFTPSTGSFVRQYNIAFRLALPLGTYQWWMEYTSLSGSATKFGVKAYYQPVGKPQVAVMEDTVPLSYADEEGNALPIETLVLSPVQTFDVVNTDEFTMLITWVSGEGKFHIRRMFFERVGVETSRYVMEGTLGEAMGRNSFFKGAYLDVEGQANVTDVMTFDYRVTEDMPNVVFTLKLANDAELPLRVHELEMQSLGTNPPTPQAEDFQSFRDQMVARVEAVVQQSFQQAADAFGTATPVFLEDGTYWTRNSTENWMSFIETCHPRLRQIENIEADALYYGRQYVVHEGTIQYGGVTYYPEDQFYAVPASGTVWTSTTPFDVVFQVGAFAKSNSGHIGKPALIPTGLELDVLTGLVYGQYDGTSALPQIVALQPWMVAQGIYTVQPELWSPEQLLPVPLVEISEEPIFDELETTVTDNVTVTGNFVYGSLLEWVLYEYGTAVSPFLYSGALASAIVSSTVVETPGTTFAGTGYSTFTAGTYYSVVLNTGSLNEGYWSDYWGTHYGTFAGTGYTTFNTGTYLLTVVGTVAYETGTLAEFAGTVTGAFSTGTYLLTVISAGTIKDYGTTLVNFLSGSLGPV